MNGFSLMEGMKHQTVTPVQPLLAQALLGKFMSSSSSVYKIREQKYKIYEKRKVEDTGIVNFIYSNFGIF